MDRIKKHVKLITNQLNLSDKEKKELTLQFTDHISSLKEYYIDKGSEESEAVSLAIRDFGDENNLITELSSNTSIKSGAKKIIAIIFYVYMFVLLGHYLKLVVDYEGVRLRLNSIIPFAYILPLTKNVLRYGFNINNLDYIITYGLAFIPVGMLMPFMCNQYNSFKSNFKVFLILAFGILTVRIIFNLGLVFIDQGIMHLAGCLAGYFIYKGITTQPKIKRALFK